MWPTKVHNNRGLKVNSFCIGNIFFFLFFTSTSNCSLFSDKVMIPQICRIRMNSIWLTAKLMKLCHSKLCKEYRHRDRIICNLSKWFAITLAFWHILGGVCLFFSPSYSYWNSYVVFFLFLFKTNEQKRRKPLLHVQLEIKRQMNEKPQPKKEIKGLGRVIISNHHYLNSKLKFTTF